MSPVLQGHGKHGLGVNENTFVDPARQEQNLIRRSKQIAAQVKDAERVYDPVAEATWHKKYKFFSEMKMKATYRTFARARHDPFNKDPAWGKAVLSNVARFCKERGMTAQDVFDAVNSDGDATLNKPEMKKALVRVFPSLSDQECIAIFDVIDEDHSGEVSVDEFAHAMETGRNAKINKEATKRHRNPVHRIKRLPPARMEGWDHLQDPEAVMGTKYEKVGRTANLKEMCTKEANEALGRISDVLMASPRALHHQSNLPKYYYFGGGADTGRFRRKDYQRSLMSEQDSLSSRTTPEVPELADPGGLDVRPGFLCDPKNRMASVLNGFSALSPRTSSRASG